MDWGLKYKMNFGYTYFNIKDPMSLSCNNLLTFSDHKNKPGDDKKQPMCNIFQTLSTLKRGGSNMLTPR